MYFEAAVPGAGSRGSVSFLTRPGDALPALRLDGKLPTGEWRALSSEPTVETGLPVPGLRGEAIGELRRCGITHVLIHDREPLGPDFRAQTAAWGVAFVAEALPLRLYEILPANSIDTARDFRNNER
jgi:hypothetical protein